MMTRLVMACGAIVFVILMAIVVLATTGDKEGCADWRSPTEQQACIDLTREAR